MGWKTVQTPAANKISINTAHGTSAHTGRGDRARADSLLAVAVETARRLGMVSLQQKIRSLTY